jgi:hypothetical protein
MQRIRTLGAAPLAALMAAQRQADRAAQPPAQTNRDPCRAAPFPPQSVGSPSRRQPSMPSRSTATSGAPAASN